MPRCGAHTPERFPRQRFQVHGRTAALLLRLCRANGGIYTKAGQMLSTAQGIPPAYRAALASLQDAAPPRPFDDVDAVLLSELGAPAATLFASFEPQAAAAASLAQARRACACGDAARAAKAPSRRRPPSHLKLARRRASPRCIARARTTAVTSPLRRVSELLRATAQLACSGQHAPR
jgi:hypothetical protein